MKSIVEITKKQTAMGVGTAAALAGGVYGGKKYLDSRKAEAATPASTTPAASIPDESKRLAPTKMAGQGVPDESKRLAPRNVSSDESTSAGLRKVASDLRKTKEEFADSSAGKGLKRAYDYYTKPGEGGQKFIQGQMKTVGDYWGKGGEGRDAVSGALKTAGKYWGPEGEGRKVIGAGIKTVADKMRKLTSST